MIQFYIFLISFKSFLVGTDAICNLGEDLKS
jgi:hypothetical protein